MRIIFLIINRTLQPQLLQFRGGTQVANDRLFYMPKYLFKLDKEGFLGDPNGTELPNLEAARERASELAQTVAQNADDFCESCSIAVIDENERPLMTIAFPKLLRK